MQYNSIYSCIVQKAKKRIHLKKNAVKKDLIISLDFNDDDDSKDDGFPPSGPARWDAAAASAATADKQPPAKRGRARSDIDIKPSQYSSSPIVINEDDDNSNSSENSDY